MAHAVPFIRNVCKRYSEVEVAVFYSESDDHRGCGGSEIGKHLTDLVNLNFGGDKEKQINFNGMNIWPDEFLTEMLKDLGYPKGYTETENLWVWIVGKHKGKKAFKKKK